MNLYIIIDKVAEKSGPVFEAINHGVACRSIQNMPAVSDHPEEFAIIHAGEMHNYGTTSVYIEPLDNLPEDLDKFLKKHSFKAATAAVRGQE